MIAPDPAVEADHEAPGPPGTTTLSAPISAARARLLSVFMILVAGAIFFAALTPPIISLSIRVFGLDPEGKTLGLSTILLVGSVLAVLGSPFFGTLSDRTRGRFGRRRPWLVAGGSLMLLGGIITGTAPNLATVAVGWAIAQLGFSATISSFFALIPDLIPDRLRGRVSGGIGMVTSLVVLGGITFASQNVTNAIVLMTAPSIVSFIAIIGLVLYIGRRDASPVDLPMNRYGITEFLGSFVINPLKNHDFAWNWISRFLLGISMVGLQTYATYFLIDAVGFDVQGAASHYATVTAISTPISIVCFLASGWLSDKLGRRKVFVIAAAIVCGVGFVVASISPTATGFLIAFLVLTVGQSFYLTVDVAIAAAVIPDHSQAAKAMGVYQVSTTAPGLIVPIIGAAVLTTSAAYVPFFIFLAAAALLAAVTILFVRRVR
ncbi:MFS transporter [Paenarthrobacter sp. FR1]|uniref:MFS transporter n=1 Tax=Paenarthrobacter sp. FR1 TaxID=3439548 RepID=UPI003DA69D20